MDCKEINEKLTGFLEDLLTGPEHREFLDHLERCPKCLERVTSIDAFSNWIWKLGDIREPGDLVSTVLFQMRCLEGSEQARRSVRRRKWIAWGLVIAVAGSIFFIFKYFEGLERQRARERQEIEKAEEAKKLLERLTVMADGLNKTGG